MTRDSCGKREEVGIEHIVHKASWSWSSGKSLNGELEGGANL